MYIPSFPVSFSNLRMKNEFLFRFSHANLKMEKEKTKKTDPHCVLKIVRYLYPNDTIITVCKIDFTGLRVNTYTDTSALRFNAGVQTNETRHIYSVVKQLIYTTRNKIE